MRSTVLPAHPNEAFGNGIFLDISALATLEADPDAALQCLLIEMLAARVDREDHRRNIIADRRVVGMGIRCGLGVFVVHTGSR